MNIKSCHPCSVLSTFVGEFFLYFYTFKNGFWNFIWAYDAYYIAFLYMTKNIEDMYCLLQVYRLGGGCSWWPTCIFPTVNILEIHTRIIHVKIISNLLAHILCNSRICSFMIYLILLWDGWWKSKTTWQKIEYLSKSWLIKDQKIKKIFRSHGFLWF